MRYHPDARHSKCEKSNCKFCGNQDADIIAMLSAKRWLWVIGVLMIVWILIVSVFMVRFIYLSPTHADENKKVVHKVNTSINVLSASFSQEFMHHAHTGSYDGIHVGMAQREAQKMLGKSTSKIRIDDKEVFIYGNIGIHYDNRIVTDLYIVPQLVTTEAFLNVHGPPTLQNNHYWYYDDDENNAHTIRVYVENNNIKAIENIPQI
ncbi:hypothetical protein [Staphylococcus agnetis]|uniref:hypothetical protein n=1 Tax=Staphylococcus agnetis TaxID=985762 RepID=UPI001648A8C3|nr:hypothetical protein [Staphylococcus agnetis]